MALFNKRRKRLPQVREGSFFARRRGVISGLYGRRERLPRLASYSRPHYRKGKVVRLIIGVAVGMLILAITAPYWLPLLTVVVPKRCIMAYAPESLQLLIFQIDVNERVPTPSGAEQDVGSELFADTVLPTTTPTSALPISSVSLPSEGYIQPTSIAVAPTPTLTLVFSLDVDPRAADKDHSADLNHIDALLTGFTWEQQGYNNCGPASIRTLMSYWDVDFTEAEAASFLKPNPDDPNVRPDELARFVESKGYHLITRINGNFDVLKYFILAGYPVLIETGYDPEPQTVGWTSHFLTLAGYSEQDRGFVAMDTYRRPNWFYTYRELDTFWRQFNRRYMVVYRSDQAAAVASIVGENMDDQTMFNNALYTATLERNLDRNDPYAWFNMGSSLVGLGRYDEAALAFDQARILGLPWRFLWYQFTPFEAYLQVGRYDDVVDLADKVLAKTATEEAFYYKGLAYAAMGEKEKARQQLNLALRYNKNYEAARQALELVDD